MGRYSRDELVKARIMWGILTTNSPDELGFYADKYEGDFDLFKEEVANEFLGVNWHCDCLLCEHNSTSVYVGEWRRVNYCEGVEDKNIPQCPLLELAGISCIYGGSPYREVSDLFHMAWKCATEDTFPRFAKTKKLQSIWSDYKHYCEIIYGLFTKLLEECDD